MATVVSFSYSTLCAYAARYKNCRMNRCNACATHFPLKTHNFNLINMSRRMTFRNACLHLGITEDNIYNDDSDVEDNLYSNNSNHTVEEEEETAPTVDEEGNVEIFKENVTDEEDEEDEETANADDSNTDHEDEKCVLSRSGIEYSTCPIPARRQMQNILTQSFKFIANPRSEIEGFELFLSEDILRTVLMLTNRKAREIRRTLSRLQPFKKFSMDELKAGLAIILRAGIDRDNFTKRDNL